MSIKETENDTQDKEIGLEQRHAKTHTEWKRKCTKVTKLTTNKAQNTKYYIYLNIATEEDTQLYTPLRNIA